MESRPPISVEETQEQEKPLVLVVDDDPIHHKLMELLADHLDVDIVLVYNCSQALEALQRNNYDAILMDCRMPDIDGYRCTQKIRALNATHKQIPIIAVTANVMPGNREKCIAAGMNDFLPKPFALDDLNHKLSLWLQVER